MSHTHTHTHTSWDVSDDGVEVIGAVSETDVGDFYSG